MIAPRGITIARMCLYVGVPLLLLFLYDMAVVLAYMLMHWKWVALPHIPLALFGSAIGLIVAFRNQSCYARWWEARILWGAIVNNSRSWGRMVTTTMRTVDAADTPELKEMQRRLVYLQIAFVHALRQQLRRLDPLEHLALLVTAQELEALRTEKNVALGLQQQMGLLLRQCLQRGWVDMAQWHALNGTLDDLADAQGGSERIKNTPMPKQYEYFPTLFVHIYCVLLPLALVTSMGWFTPLGSTLVGFIFLALNQIGHDLEDPFENTMFDIPLTSISTTIEINLRQLLGETELPEPTATVHGVMW
jgi:ion channel-forming bestrophin family protein